MPPTFDHLALSVPDLDRAADFYIGLLGLQEVHRTSWERGNERMDALMALTGSAADVLIVKAANVEIEFFCFRHPEQSAQVARTAASYGYTHFALKVEGIESVYETLLGAGTIFHTPPYVGRCGRTLTYFRDPFGNIVELVEGDLIPWSGTTARSEQAE